MILHRCLQNSPLYLSYSPPCSFTPESWKKIEEGEREQKGSGGGLGAGGSGERWKSWKEREKGMDGWGRKVSNEYSGEKVIHTIVAKCVCVCGYRWGGCQKGHSFLGYKIVQ